MDANTIVVCDHCEEEKTANDMVEGFLPWDQSYKCYTCVRLEIDEGATLTPVNAWWLEVIE